MSLFLWHNSDLNLKDQDSKEDKDKQLKAIYSDIEFIDIMEAVCSDARNYVSDNPRASLEQFKEHIQINDVLCDWIENAPVDHVISKIDIIQEHVNIFLEQNPSASEENIKQCICEIGDFVQVGIENIDFHTLMQKIEATNRAKKRKVYITAIAMATIILFVVYCICDIIYTKSIAPAYVTETIVILDETIYPDETDPTEFPSESSSVSVE